MRETDRRDEVAKSLKSDGCVAKTILDEMDFPEAIKLLRQIANEKDSGLSIQVQAGTGLRSQPGSTRGAWDAVTVSRTDQTVGDRLSRLLGGTPVVYDLETYFNPDTERVGHESKAPKCRTPWGPQSVPRL